MKSTINIFALTASLFLGCNIYSQTTCGSLCTNPGFESGEGVWTYQNGTACQAPTSEPCDLVNDSVAPFQHELQTGAGFDPIVGGNILPIVPPGGGNNAMRLGDGNVSGNKASRISISYDVTNATANFVYQYAVVLEDPKTAPGTTTHDDAQRPYFSINVYDAASNSISCGDLFVLAKPPLTNFTETSNGSNIYYRGWTREVVSLAAYIGQCVTIEFTSTDCTLGDHFGYAYLDASCEPIDSIITSTNNCGGFTLTAPTGAPGYAWTNISVGGTTGIDGADNTESINVVLPGTYQVIMASPLGPSCSSKLSIAVDTGFSNPTDFTPLTTCSNNVTQFTDISTPGGDITGWDWDFDNDGNTDDTNQNPGYSFPTSGTYPVTLTITMDECTAFITKDVAVSIPPLPAIDPAGPFCTGADPVFLNVDVAGGTWSGNGVDPSTGVFDPSLATVGNNTISYATAGQCSGMDSIVILVEPPISNPGPNTTICSGNTVSIGNPAITGETYNWTPTTGLSSSTVANPTVTLTNTGSSPQSIVYYLTSTLPSTGCFSTDSAVVTVNAMPLVNAGPDKTICSGNTVVLQGSVSGATTSYSWSGGSGTYNPNNITLQSTYSPSTNEVTAESVFLTLTTNAPDGPCPSANDQMEITINASPSVSAGPDQTVCIGSTINLAGNITGSSQGTWSGGNGTFLPNTTTANASYTPTTNEGVSGFVTLVYTSNSGGGLCISSFSQMTIFINSLPTAYAGSDKTLCDANSISLAGSISGQVGITASWSGGDGTYTPNNTDLTATYTPTSAEAAANAFTLDLTTDPIGVCPSTTDQVEIAINQVATVNAGIDQTICVDNAAITSNTLTLAGVTGGVATSGLWTGGAGTFTPNNSAANATYSLDQSEITKSSVILTYTSNDPAGPCPAVNDQMTIFINQLPAVVIAPDQTICEGATVALTSNVSGFASSVTWSGGTGSFIPNSSSKNSIYTPSASEIAAGSVQLILTTNDPPGPCPSASDQTTLNIYSSSTVSAGPDQSICGNSSFTLAGVSTGNLGGTWSGGTGTYTPNNIVLNPTYTPSTSEVDAGFASLTFTSDNTGPCAASSDQMNITIYDRATSNAGTVLPVCIGSTIQLGGSVGGAASFGTWSGGTGTYIPNNNTLNATYTPSDEEYTNGTATLTLTTNDPIGDCPADSTQTTANFLASPIVDFNVNSSAGCAIHCTDYIDQSSVSGSADIINWNWDFGDGSSSTLENPSHCYSHEGSFTVTLRVNDSDGCTATTYKDSLIEVYEKPTAIFSVSPNPVSILNPEVSFTDHSSLDVDYWYWNFGDGTTLGTDTQNPIHTYAKQTTTYQPVLIVRNANNCYDTVNTHAMIRVIPKYSFFIPNAFTPDNGDGINDYFGGAGTGITMYDMWIFDRWGIMIFHGEDIDDKWDGRVVGLLRQGEFQAQRDVYVWKVTLTDVFGNVHNYVGTVTLAR